MCKSQYNKPLILNEKDIDSSKQNAKKSFKCKISTPKYTQINLKRGNLIPGNESGNGMDKKSAKAKRDLRDKSSNGAKKGKYFIEIARITASNKSRGVSADEIMGDPGQKPLEKQSKTVKNPKSKIIKVQLIILTSIG